MLEKWCITVHCEGLWTLSLFWGSFLGGPRVACPPGNLFKADSSLHPEQDDLMTVGPSWDRQVPFPTDLYPPRRTKTEPMYLVSPLFQEVSWELHPHDPGELALGGSLGPARTKAKLSLRPHASSWALPLLGGGLGRVPDPRDLRLLFCAGRFGLCELMPGLMESCMPLLFHTLFLASCQWLGNDL